MEEIHYDTARDYLAREKTNFPSHLMNCSTVFNDNRCCSCGALKNLSTIKQTLREANRASECNSCQHNFDDDIATSLQRVIVDRLQNGNNTSFLSLLYMFNIWIELVDKAGQGEFRDFPSDSAETYSNYICDRD